MKKILILILLFNAYSITAQKFLNLDFEKEITGNLPLKWYVNNQGYITSVDTLEKFSGDKSLKIRSNNPSIKQFGMASRIFPIAFAKGKNITFKGRIKTKMVENGYAGIWWRVDGKNRSILGFDNMNDRGLVGDNDWTEVSIKMKVDDEAVNILFGSLLTGEGIAWFDDFNIFIEGEEFIDARARNTKPTDEELWWLENRIHPLKSFDPQFKENEDLDVLKKMINGKTVVALGENTHGSKEIFQMKHRIIKYLTQEDDFDIFSMEANMPEAYNINEYTIDQKGDPKELIKGMYFWTWRTQEVLDMIEWMKIQNQSNKKIKFTGFDMQFFEGAMSELNKALGHHKQITSDLNELDGLLKIIKEKEKKARKIIVSDNELERIGKLLNSIRQEINTLNFKKEKRNWLNQNLRIIEQYLKKTYTARDKFMAENLLWIKEQSPKSKIVLWAHNSHVKETETSMGKYLSKELGEEYISIGFTFHKGNYSAYGKNGLSTYEAQESYLGTYEYFFKSINEPMFILDLREARKNISFYGDWLKKEELEFRRVGAVKKNMEFFDASPINDYDILIFINESTNTKVLEK